MLGSILIIDAHPAPTQQLDLLCVGFELLGLSHPRDCLSKKRGPALDSHRSGQRNRSCWCQLYNIQDKLSNKADDIAHVPRPTV